MVMSDELTFDNPIVKELLINLDPYWYPIFTFIFMPFMTNFGLVTYYFCFILSDPNEPREGFISGSKFGSALRIFILGSTAYLFILDIVSAIEIIKNLMKAKEDRSSLKRFYFGLATRLLKTLLLLVNVWIILEHSINFNGIEVLALS